MWWISAFCVSKEQNLDLQTLFPLLPNFWKWFPVCFQGIPELAGCLFREERRGQLQGWGLASFTFNHLTLRISHQKGCPLFLLHQVIYMRGAGSPAGLRKYCFLLHGLGLWSGLLRMFGSLAQARMIEKEFASQKALQWEKSLPQNIHWIATEIET